MKYRILMEPHSSQGAWFRIEERYLFFFWETVGNAPTLEEARDSLWKLALREGRSVVVYETEAR